MPQGKLEGTKLAAISVLDAIKARTENRDKQEEKTSIHVKATMTVENGVIVLRAPLNTLPLLDTVRVKPTEYKNDKGEVTRTVHRANIAFTASMPDNVVLTFKDSAGNEYHFKALSKGMVDGTKCLNIGFIANEPEEVIPASQDQGEAPAEA